MIAADTSSLIAFFGGENGQDVDKVQQALNDGELRISPIVFTELLSDPRTTMELERTIADWRQLAITEGYWLRAARTRAKLIALKLQPKLPDTLIAQSCLDHNATLIARVGGFRHFAKHCGLKLA